MADTAEIYPGCNGRLTTSGGAFHDSSWGPGGHKIVYTHGSTAYDPRELWVMRAGGTGHDRSTTVSGEISDPSFLPGGKKVVFTV